MQPNRLADLPHRGRIAVTAQIAADEVEDLLLALRQVLDEIHLVLLSQPLGAGGAAWGGRTHVRESSAGRGRLQAVFWVEPSPPRGSGRSRVRPLSSTTLAPVAELVDAQG